ncbi:hypothetical protein OCA8868_00533 [Octadecabacter ascidiaceicola]|uniref:Uncharacterized protein n=1 Tax=Octadecabacter ascidiaceicola TaxID=1655543 RepID=A0A238JMU6_9RHOB|nr:hypothetical protein OCA8868_00533 [Octadecabacter ascidiaceicola]
MYLNSRTLEILNWIKANLERPGAPEPESHSRQFYLSVSRLSSGEFGKADLKLVFEWTRPRSEVVSSFDTPPGYETHDSWAPLRAMNELHAFLQPNVDGET